MRGSHARIHAAVRRIPAGRVATYGQIARLAGLAGQARQVGYALSALPAGSRVPWHRVVNARGEISARFAPEFERVQRERLEREGVVFGPGARIALEQFQWIPRAPRSGAGRYAPGEVGRR
jgi:methylated-DNA-protein-cysteine methyltransferase-like protein